MFVRITVISLAALFAIALYFAGNMGDKSPKIASGTVVLENEQRLNDFSAVYVTVFDEASRRPMPFGAIRLAHGDTVRPQLQFVLTPDNLQRMNPAAPLPKSMRIKARFDVDGLGGPDQAGDFVGEVRGVELGTEGVKIVAAPKNSDSSKF